MNILMLTLMYPQDQLQEVSVNVKDKLQNQINSYQRAFVKGIRSNLEESEQLDILNCLPVGIFPLQYRKLILKSGLHDEGSIQQLGCINLPWLKQKWRAFAAQRAIEKWAESDPANRTVLVYTQYLPYMQALHQAKKRFPDLKAAVIVTDLPSEMGLSSGRKGLLKALEDRMGQRSIALLRQMDGYILLTAPMADALQINGKPTEVIEGLILSDDAPVPEASPSSKPFFLYTGTLESSLGIPEMLAAFEEMPEYELWICGHGSMNAQIEEYASRCPNIRFFGFVPQQEALTMQASAAALLNPRQPSGIFTKYSFPSKTLEYMRSGKPVLCCRLEGIPSDYDPYLCYMDEGKEGIIRSVRSLMRLEQGERIRLGQEAREYVLKHKNPHVQCRKLLSLLRRL